MFENIRQAFRGIWSHKMRSFLTMLGIIIGIAAIIAIVSTIKGTSEQIKQDLIGSGNNTVTIQLTNGDSTYEVGGYMDSGGVTPVLSEDLKEQVRKAEHVKNATFYYSRTYTNSVYYGSKVFSGGSIYGIDEHYLTTCSYLVQSGRGFVTDDYDKLRKVAILDSNAAENLFGGENPIGKIIEIGSEPYTVVGIVAKSEDSMPTINTISEYNELYQTITGSVMIPYRSWPVSFQFDEPMNAIVQADSTDTMSSVGSAAEEIMNQAIISSATEKSSFSYKADNVMERVKNMQRLSQSTNQQLIWIASISLLVGGIGVMNIMLVSVTERTKEIGLKKAIGARKKVILGQFLTEAAVLTSLGGMIGVLVGVILSRLVSRVAGTPTAISIPAAVIAVVFSMMIGIIFGLLPSVKAANLNPIDALRSE